MIDHETLLNFNSNSIDGSGSPANIAMFGFGTTSPGFPDYFGFATVDQFMAWNRVLTAAEVTAIYNDQLWH